MKKILVSIIAVMSFILVVSCGGGGGKARRGARRFRTRSRHRGGTQTRVYRAYPGRGESGRAASSQRGGKQRERPRNACGRARGLPRLRARRGIRRRHRFQIFAGARKNQGDVMNLTEKTVEKHTLYKGFIINLRVDDALLPDGRPCKREMVEHPGGAAVLCVEDGKVLLVRQFRYAYGEELLEIPAGKLDKGEDPAHAAARELEEETGRVAERVEKLFTLYPTPGYTNEKLHVFLAHGVHMGHVHPDDDEFVSVVRIPLADVSAMIADGRIRDAKTIAAVQRYLLDKAEGGR